jgi:hypothetical protein
VTDADRPLALGLLDVLAGEWTQVIIGHGDPTGTMSFEWSLDGRYLLQRSILPPPFPEVLAVIEYDEAVDEFRQHYFDSRGVTRVYRMTLSGSDLMLQRTESDFSDLSFAQRFVAVIADDGRSVHGRWEQSHDGGATWDFDFGVAFTRRT